MTVRVREATEPDLDVVLPFERQPHAAPFIHAKSVAEHLDLFRNPDTRYLVIENENNEIVGYFILVLEDDGTTIEFRRIVVDANRRGVGQAAIVAMLDYCRNLDGRSRVWLDVYDDNDVGRHIYEKLGFRLDRVEPRGDRQLRFYSLSL